MAYQSYTYGSNHYPQTPYAHLQQYQAQQLHTSTAPVQIVRQQTQSQANEVDTADVATLNDALGSAGVDLRVRVHNCNLLIGFPDENRRLRKKRCNDRRIITRLTEFRKTARESSLRTFHSILEFWALRCEILALNIK